MYYILYIVMCDINMTTAWLGEVEFFRRIHSDTDRYCSAVSRLLLSRNFRLELAERTEKIPSRAENARLSGSQVYMFSYCSAVNCCPIVIA